MTSEPVAESESLLLQLLAQQVAERGEEVFLVDDRARELTFADLDAASSEVGSWLQRHGRGDGARVSWQLPTSIEAIVLIVALVRVGAVQNPMLPIYREREMTAAFAAFKPQSFLAPKSRRGVDHLDIATRSAASLAEKPVITDISEGLPSDGSRDHPRPGPSSDPRFILFTSGTSGDPKGVVHSEETVAAAAAGLVAHYRVDANDRVAIVFPITHIGGLVWLYAGLMAGCRLILTESFDRAIVEILRREAVTVAGAGTPFLLTYLDAQRELPAGERLFPDVRAFTSGGAPKLPRLHRTMKAELGGVGVLSAWGLTEAPILTAATPDQPDDELEATEGLPLPGVEVIVVRADGSRATPGEPGELRARAPQQMLGYLDSRQMADAFDENGYLKTGDLGMISASGAVSVVGRLKDVIIRNGENISAAEVEALLIRHDRVKDAAVVGLPDARTGEQACAVIIPVGVAPTLGELCEFLRAEGLMMQKLPERLEVVDALPRDPSGKLRKAELRERFSDD